MKFSCAAFAFVLLVGCKQKPAECPPPVECPPAGSAAAEHADHAAHAVPAAPAGDAAGPANVVQTEMRMLQQVLEATVRGIGAMDVRGIDEQLHALHGAKEATTAAVKSGAYKLPKNAENVAAFEQMDEAFHKDLVGLVKASRANDVPAAAEALGQIVRSCNGCHAMFRP